MPYQGSCHCGAVKYSFDAPIERVMECNCSICARKGHLLAFGPLTAFTLHQGKDALGDYQFGKKNIHHHFCKNCGIGVFGRAKQPDGNEGVAINARCIEGLDFKALPVDQFDGKSL
ncbi:MAG: GFA family protein [Rickettsiales bacterium]